MTPGVAWITGAGRGIGRALALALAREGWRVAASARTAADLDSLAAQAPANSVLPLILDVTDRASMGPAVRRIEAELGPLDLAVMNAGTHAPDSTESVSSDAFRYLLDINVMGVVNGLEAVLPGMRARRRGRVAVVSSLAGYRGLPSASAYGATKAALINMAEALEPELRRDGIRLSLINPGFVDTPLTRRNDFPMPFLISAERAAHDIIVGLSSSRFEIAFPWRFAFLMKCLRLLPNRLYLAMTRRLVR